MDTRIKFLDVEWHEVSDYLLHFITNVYIEWKQDFKLWTVNTASCYESPSKVYHYSIILSIQFFGFLIMLHFSVEIVISCYCSSTEFNNVLPSTLFNVVNNIVQRCYTWLLPESDSAILFNCWQHWTILAAIANWKTWFNTVFTNPKQVVNFLLCSSVEVVNFNFVEIPHKFITAVYHCNAFP